MASEMTMAANWVYQTLSGDSALSVAVGGRIYPDLAPVGAARPYVVYSLQTGPDTNSLGLERATARPHLLVKAVGDGDSFSPLAPIVDRIDALLHGAKATLPASNITASRASEVRYHELRENVRYNHQGGVYSLALQPT